MMYLTFRDMIFIHWFLGVSFAIAATIWALYKDKDRHLFVFGGDVLSLGDKHQWLKWYIVCYVFEVITSIFYFKAGMMYVEIAMSVWQAGLMVVGGFMVDRIVTLFSTPPTAASRTMQEVRDSVTKKASELKDNLKIKTPKVDEETIQKEKDDFDSLVKGH